MKHFTVTFKPDGKEVSIHVGATLLEAASQAGIILNTVCGGKGTCNKCAVQLEPQGHEVLACQYHIESDLTVTVPQASRFFEHKILAEGVETKTEPDIHEKHVKFAPPDQILGLAIDIGTTTVVAKLINMADGECLATQSALNPQSRYGDDVVNRISYAETDEKLAELQTVIIDCINELIARLCKQSDVDRRHICEACIVGNTTMNHLFLKLPVAQLGQAPYKAHSLDAYDVPAAELGLQINPAGNVHTVENIAGFVGADTTAVALAVDIGAAQDVTLVVDIGTNGELVFAAAGKLYAASCAAGPALEGARIAHGSRAVEGAIEAVLVNQGDIDLDVIGGGSPCCICGSGLIDAVAVLLNLGVVDDTGRFASPATLGGKLSPAIADRIIEQNGQPAFSLAGGVTTSQRAVVLTQKDVRELQLAKGAIRTGIEMLLRKTGLKASDIQRILLAGAFGNYIRPESAVRIGLLPDVPLDRIHFVGNAASSGARMMLLSSQCRAQAKQLAREIQYIEIAHESDFQMIFAESMWFTV
jgi:uncharacterized 2Fe-2S/4Fe-4S cluster protein (DUF4445 family)